LRIKEERGSGGVDFGLIYYNVLLWLKKMAARELQSGDS
jgi:hypothetical protein